MALVPRTTKVYLARKYPGNSGKAQDELLQIAEEELRRGRDVLRLKQGDPFVYGRGGEEVEWFQQRGFRVRVLPGVSSALAAPACAGIPPTMRDLSLSIEIHTGTGKGGKDCPIPPYRPETTYIFMMALHRLASLVETMTSDARIERSTVRDPDEAEQEPALETRIGTLSVSDNPPSEPALISNSFTPYPPHTPCAIIERASCSDQRVIYSTLESVKTAFDQEGSRPPGLLAVGRACMFALKAGLSRLSPSTSAKSPPGTIFTHSAPSVNPSTSEPTKDQEPTPSECDITSDKTAAPFASDGDWLCGRKWIVVHGWADHDDLTRIEDWIRSRD